MPHSEASALSKHTGTTISSLGKKPMSLSVAVVVPAKRYYCAGALLWQARYGPLQVASVLQEHGHTVRIFNEELGGQVDIDHVARHFDVLAVSSKTSALTRATQIAEGVKQRARELGRTITTVLGGEHASMVPTAPPVFDHVLRGEAELALVQLLDLLRMDAPGTASRADSLGRPSHRAPLFDNIPDLSIIDGYLEATSSLLFRRARPLWMAMNRRIPVLSFQGARGCPYACSFCPTPTHLQGRKYRRRTPESAVEWLRTHVAATGIRDVIFEDPTGALPHDERSHAFFEALAKADLGIRATVLVRSDLVSDEPLLGTMRRAGVSSVSIGLESTSLETCKSFNKRTDPTDYSRSVETFKRYGFVITGLFMVGDDNDKVTCFEDIASFIRDHGIEKWRVSPISQAPEVVGEYLPPHRVFLWTELDQFGERVEDWLNGDYVTIFPRHMPPSVLQTKIMKFQLDATSMKEAVQLLRRTRDAHSFLHRLGNNYSQRRLQHSVAHTDYIAMLRKVEAPFYTRIGDGWLLDEEALIHRLSSPDRIRLAI